MFFAILQAAHGYFLDGWKEEDPDCKLPNLEEIAESTDTDGPISLGEHC